MRFASYMICPAVFRQRPNNLCGFVYLALLRLGLWTKFVLGSWRERCVLFYLTYLRSLVARATFDTVARIRIIWWQKIESFKMSCCCYLIAEWNGGRGSSWQLEPLERIRKPRHLLDNLVTKQPTLNWWPRRKITTFKSSIMGKCEMLMLSKPIKT